MIDCIYCDEPICGWHGPAISTGAGSFMHDTCFKQHMRDLDRLAVHDMVRDYGVSTVMTWAREKNLELAMTEKGLTSVK